MNQVWNTLKTTLLLGALTGLFLFIGASLGGSTGMFIALLFAVALNMGAWWYSDKLALKFSRAREVTPEEMPELHRMVETLAVRAGIPKPRVYIMDSQCLCDGPLAQQGRRGRHLRHHADAQPRRAGRCDRPRTGAY